MKIVVYTRVSTKRQGESGLGLDAQRAAIRAFKRQHRCDVVARFREIESGKRSDNRPQLAKAIAACRRHKATLVIAKLDRLARNVHFISGLMEAKVPFVCCDNPTATPLTLHVLAAVAEAEAMAISTRTREALARAKKRGKVLGTPANLTRSDRRKGTKANVRAAQEFAAKVLPIARKMRDDGATFDGIATALNDQGVLTRRGNGWSGVAVMRLLG